MKLPRDVCLRIAFMLAAQVNSWLKLVLACNMHAYAREGGGAEGFRGHGHVIVYGGRVRNILCNGALRKPCACAKVEKFSEISRHL